MGDRDQVIAVLKSDHINAEQPHMVENDMTLKHFDHSSNLWYHSLYHYSSGQRQMKHRLTF